MKVTPSIRILIALCLSLFSLQSFSTPYPWHQQLKKPHHILMMRHADAPGYSDPTGFDLKNCATQRNLGEKGRQQAREIGEWLKTNGVSHARILSSPWCRCQDTAKLLNLGSVQTEHSLGSFFENRSAESKQMHQLRQKIQAELMYSKERPLILVTHQVNIQAFTGISASSGQMVLVEVSSDGQYKSHQIITRD